MDKNVVTIKSNIRTDSGRCYLFGSRDYYFRYVIPVNQAVGYSAKSVEDARIQAANKINANTTALRWFKRMELLKLSQEI